MLINLELSPEAEAGLFEQAKAEGLNVTQYLQSLVLQQLGSWVAVPDLGFVSKPESGVPVETRAQQAGRRIRELRRGVNLRGISIRELIEEGRE